MKILGEILIKKENPELQKGIEEEREHLVSINKLLDFFKVSGDNRAKGVEEFLKNITEDHIKKIPNYYTKLDEMEKE